MKERIWFIVNPISGGRKKAELPELIAAHLNHNKFTYEIIYTEHKGHAVELAQKAVDLGIDIVCAVGGDGSVHEVGTTLIGSNTQLAIIPLGSGNGLARHMKIPLKIKEALECINSGNIIEMDTLKVNNKPILGFGGYGFDALIAKKFAGSTKRGFTSYVKLVIQEVFKYNPINVSIDANGQVRKLPVFLCTIANTSEFGNGFIVSPKSDATDGKFELVILKPFSFWNIPAMLFRYFSGRTDHSGLTEVIKTDHATLVLPHSYGQIDGEPISSGKKVQVDVVPRSLRIIVK
ncbi:MAG: diacylglycerol/lipid kinase family protein [Flavobacteriales bacterium]